MAKARVARGDDLAAQAWAAGCRDVQAAINWATARGEAAGRPFLAAFRRVMTAQQEAPAAVPPAATAAADPGPSVTEGRGKRKRQGGTTRPDQRPARAKPEGNGRSVGEPAAGRGAGATVDPKAGTPIEFVEDMQVLRQLVAKYGKKGLADLIGMLAG